MTADPEAIGLTWSLSRPSEQCRAPHSRPDMGTLSVSIVALRDRLSRHDRVTPARLVARPAPQARLRTLDESSISYESGRQPELAGTALKSIGRIRLVRERKE